MRLTTWKRKLKNLLLMMLVLIIVIILLYPFFWVLSASFQPEMNILRGDISPIPTDTFTLDNYIPLFTTQYGIMDFYQYLINSAYVGLPTALISTLIATMGGYALSRYDIPGKEIFARLLLLTYVFPLTLMIMPVERIMAFLGLVNSRGSLILVHIALAVPFCTWLLRTFFEAVPRRLEEAALVDGCTPFQAFRKVVFPLARPGVITVFVYALVESWGEFLFASILIRSDELKTVPMGLADYTAEQYIEWGRLLAGTVVTFLPLVIFFLLVSGYFIRGFLEGAMKI